MKQKDKNMTKIKIEVPEDDINEEMLILKGTYANNGKMAIMLFGENGEQYIDVTVNIEFSNLLDNEVTVKSWGENELFLDSFLESGYFRDTGKRIPTGYVEAQVWEVIKPISDMELFEAQ